jgi:hypothetical protein
LRDAAATAALNAHSEYRDSSPAVDPAAIEAPIVHLAGIGARWGGGAGADRTVLRKVLSAELGDPGEPVVSSNGVISTIRKLNRSGLVRTTIITNTPRPTADAAERADGAINAVSPY